MNDILFVLRVNFNKRLLVYRVAMKPSIVSVLEKFREADLEEKKKKEQEQQKEKEKKAAVAAADNSTKEVGFIMHVRLCIH